MDGISFRRDFNGPPSGYRTPSPPLSAIESLSPTFGRRIDPTSPLNAVGGTSISVRPARGDETESEDKFVGIRGNDAVKNIPEASAGYVDGSDSASTMDTFATIALATSPAYSPASRNLSHTSPLPASFNGVFDSRYKSHEIHGRNRENPNERPAKRARSELTTFPERSATTQRPATSHIPYPTLSDTSFPVKVVENGGDRRNSYSASIDSSSMSTDAELLLHLARATTVHSPLDSRGGNISVHRRTVDAWKQTALHSLSEEQHTGFSQQHSAANLSPFNSKTHESQDYTPHISTDKAREATSTMVDALGIVHSNASRINEQSSTSMTSASRPNIDTEQGPISRLEAMTPRREKTGDGEGKDGETYTFPGTAQDAAEKTVEVGEKAKRVSVRGRPRGRPAGQRSGLSSAKKVKSVAFEGQPSPNGVRNPRKVGNRNTNLKPSANASLQTSELHGTEPTRQNFSIVVEEMRESEAKGRRKSVPTFETISSGENGRPARNRPRSAPPDSSMPYPPSPSTNRINHSSPTQAATCAGCNMSRNSLSAEPESDATSWISCDGCKRWFHFACAGFKSEREVRSVDKFICKGCKPKFGATTFVRKSSRAHSTIDYVGLNEGIVKTSDDDPEHHYIKSIKEGTFKFLPDNFARMSAELVTAEFFEKGNGMKDPVVIPASLNQSPPDLDLNGHAPDIEQDSLNGDDIYPEGDDTDISQPPDQTYEYVPDVGQDGLDMVVPRGLTVRQVAELYGPNEKVEVIDVKSQEGEGKQWNMQRWADYYESKGEKVVRNVISLEVSSSQLGRLIKRPKVVRDLDLQDSVWPSDLIAKGEYPKVQFYCLMSVADCFTDFHIDFGGSSVYYQVLKGKKTFFFIPPKNKHLKKYEEWCMSPAQNWTFLPDQTKECYRVDLDAGDTMLIPSGWIHAVWTPEDSLVIGGNFLTRLHYGMQIRIAEIEKNTKVARKFRYPYFQKILWYTAMRYLEEDPLPPTVIQALCNGQKFYRDIPVYYEFDSWGANSKSGVENYNRRYYSQLELEGLPDMARYLLRTALIAMGCITEGITVSTKNAVMRSIPKGQGSPLDVVKKFAMWSAWKRGNEHIPHWAHPEVVPGDANSKAQDNDQTPSTVKKAKEVDRPAPERQSARRQSQIEAELLKQTESVTNESSGVEPSKPQSMGSKDLKSKVSHKRKSTTVDSTTRSAKTAKRDENSTPKTPSIGPRKLACDDCRKRRIRCKHKDEAEIPPKTEDQVLSSATVNGASTSRSLEVVHNNIVVNGESSLAVSQPDAEDVNGLDSHGGGRPHEPAYSPNVEHLGTPKFLLQSSKKLLHSLPHTPSEQPNVPPLQAGNSQPNGGTSNTARKIKACNDCRKSKRRCVHDENGNIDPQKAEEAELLRTSVSAKRRRESGDLGKSQKGKRSKEASLTQRSASKVRAHNFEVVIEKRQSGLGNNEGLGDSNASYDGPITMNNEDSAGGIEDRTIITSPLAETERTKGENLASRCSVSADDLRLNRHNLVADHEPRMKPALEPIEPAKEHVESVQESMEPVQAPSAVVQELAEQIRGLNEPEQELSGPVQEPTESNQEPTGPIQVSTEPLQGSKNESQLDLAPPVASAIRDAKNNPSKVVQPNSPNSVDSPDELSGSARHDSSEDPLQLPKSEPDFSSGVSEPQPRARSSTEQYQETSPPTSPLTDIDFISPPPEEAAETVDQEAPIPSAKTARQSSRRPKQIIRYATEELHGSYIPKPQRQSSPRQNSITPTSVTNGTGGGKGSSSPDLHNINPLRSQPNPAASTARTYSRKSSTYSRRSGSAVLKTPPKPKRSHHAKRENPAKTPQHSDGAGKEAAKASAESGPVTAAEEESLRLARAIAEEEFGLRRR